MARPTEMSSDLFGEWYGRLIEMSGEIENDDLLLEKFEEEIQAALGPKLAAEFHDRLGGVISSGPNPKVEERKKRRAEYQRQLEEAKRWQEEEAKRSSPAFAESPPGLPKTSTPEQRKAVFRILVATTYTEAGANIEVLDDPKPVQNGIRARFRDRQKVFDCTISKSGKGWDIAYIPLSGVVDMGEEEIPSPCDIKDDIQLYKLSVGDRAFRNFMEEVELEFSELPADVIADRLRQRAQPIVEDWLERVKDLLEVSPDLVSFQEQLETLYPELDDGTLADLMGQAQAIARAGGMEDADR